MYYQNRLRNPTRRRYRKLAASLAAAVLLASSEPALAAGADRFADTSSPMLRSDLHAVASGAPGQAWAVGVTYSSDGAYEVTRIEHWNGLSWARVPSPNPGGTASENVLNSVAATSQGRAWAVGWYLHGIQYHCLVEAWDGHHWGSERVPLPHTFRGARCEGVTALSPRDVWVVGFGYLAGKGQRPIVEHWNGTRWNLDVMTRFPVGEGAELEAVCAHDSSDIWAVGSRTESDTQQPVFLHWNGSAWLSVSGPAGTGSVFLSGVAVTSRGTVVAVGSTGGGLNEAIVYEYVNAHWSRSPIPFLGGTSQLLGTSAVGPNNVWAVGWRSWRGRMRTLALRLRSHSWTHVPTPDFGAPISILRGASGCCGRLGFVVGADRGSNLVLSRTGNIWSRELPRDD